MAQGSTAGDGTSMQEVADALRQIVTEQRDQRGRLEELGQAVAGTAQGVTGTQAVTEQVINQVVGQVQGAFQQQQTATQEQVGQIAGAVQSLQQQLAQLVQTAANLTSPGRGGADHGSSSSGGPNGPPGPPGPPGTPGPGTPARPGYSAAADGTGGVQGGGYNGGPQPDGSLPRGPRTGFSAGGVHPAVAYALQQGGVDARVLAKPPFFDPSKTDKVSFQDWSETIITVTDAQIPGTWEILEWVANKQPKVALDQLTLLAQFPHLDRTLVEYTDSNLYAMLTTYTAGEARSLVRQAKRPNGVEAFRLLQVRFNPLTIGRQRAHLTRITNPPESVPLAQLSSEIIAWENRIMEYESKPGADVVSESLRMATIVAMCPAKLKEHLQMNASRYSRYAEIREEIFTFLDHVHGITSTPMDIGSLGKAQSKGGKGSGKGPKGGQGKSGKGKGFGKEAKGKKGGKEGGGSTVTPSQSASQDSDEGRVDSWYATADGTLVRDEGLIEPVFCSPEGYLRVLKYRVANVNKVLTSAAEICNKGHRIVLESGEYQSYIEEYDEYEPERFLEPGEVEYEPALELEDMEEITLGREKNAGQPRGSQDQQHGDVEDCLESVNPLKVALPDPREPTMEERREHNVTHIPFRSWCKHCVRGKSLGAAHRSGTGSATRKVPTISLDYFYLGDAEDNSQPNLIMTDSLTQRVFSMCMPCKGVGHQYNVMIVEKCCRILGYPKAVLKSDTEPSIVALRTEVQKKLPHLSAENATKGESQSNAQAESMVGKIQGQARTMRSALEASYQCVFGPRHPAFAWLIGYAGTLWSRFQRGVDGRTGYERSTGKQWRQRLPQFGECIWYQPLKESGTRKKKFEGKFEDGVFLGIQENSLLKWIGTPEGVTRAWSVKLRPESEKWNLEEFNSFVGLPWHLKPNVSRDGSSIIPVMEKDVVVELHDRPEPERQVVVEKRSKGYVPRGIYIRKDEELAKYGYTGGCDGCEAAKHGLSRKQHSNACRERIVKAMEETAEGKARVERARQRETAFIVAEHEKIEATAATKKRSAEDERVMDQVLKKREIDFDLDVPIPAAGTSPDPLPVEEFPGRGDGGGKPGEGNDEEPSSSSRPMDLGSLARICKKDVDTLSVVYEVSSLEARALLGDLVEEERSLMLQCGAWDVKDVYNLEVAELYSPPRVVEAGKRRGCLSGVAFDLGTTDEDGVPWDFRLPEMREKADHVIDVLQPELLLGCPPCHAFSALQWLNHPGMDDEVVDGRMKEAVGHMDFCAQQYRKQIARQKYFLHEHPKTASSWHVPSIQQLADEPGVMIVDGDMCAQKMESTDHLGTGLVLKPTRYLTNSEEIAKELGKRCSNREVDVKVWRRRDEDAKCYKGPGSGGPNWSQIFRRVTMNADTGETIEDLRWPGDCDGRAYQQKLPESSMNIETMFYYQENGPKMHRHVPLMSGRASQAQVYPRDMVNGIIKGLKKQLARKYPLNSLDFGPVNQEPDLDMSAEDDWQTYIDEVSGKPLNTAKVTEARNEELAYADKYNVWTEVPTQEAWDRLNRAMYGTRDAAACWEAEFTDFFSGKGHGKAKHIHRNYLWLQQKEGLHEFMVHHSTNREVCIYRSRERWNMTPQGTGAMGAKLDADEVDVAVMLSEGAVARIAEGSRTKVIGTYVKSPLRWGIHVKKGSPIREPSHLKGRTFGVSRMLSGSHLMAHVFAHQQGWTPATDAPLQIVGTLNGAREAMGKGEIEAWLWEKFTTKFLVDSGEWDIIGEVPTPWPCFLFVASEKALETKRAEIEDMVSVTRTLCDEFKANAGDKTVQYVSRNHALNLDDAREWLSGTEWACSLSVTDQTFVKTQEALVTIGQLKEAVAHERLYFPLR
ncbi:unnamed protein product [Effrenium voratum]|uniref:Ca3427-like PBP 2 domain-containing protein n=1 Tax=Effrenium voratum TaxID=2562239 RepID=A0AA36HMT2_9DINO|nr:unnamed protein product [Effrenium voratum]